MKTIDAILNRYTMYRVILYGLGAFLVIAGVLAQLGTISISAVGLVSSTVVLIVSCYLANKVFATIRRVPYNNESWLISALILACILPPTTDSTKLGLIALAGAIAMASKYLLVYRGSHVFNPVALGAFVVSATGLLAVTWWVATAYLTPFLVILGIIVLRKQREFTLALVFGLIALMLLLYTGIFLNGLDATEVAKSIFTAWPLIFFGSIMLNEPTTLPPTRYYKILFAILVGAIFASGLRLGPISTTPQFALLIGNLFTLMLIPIFGAMLQLKRIDKLAPDIFNLTFESPKRALRFEPGQYLEWTLPHKHTDSRGNRRMFSIASAPTEDVVMIGIRQYARSSSFKKALLAMQPGQKIRVARVSGGFTLPKKHDEPLLFMAGGIGITPIRSMLKYLVDTGQKRNIVLIYVATKQEDLVYREVFDQAKAIGLKTLYATGILNAESIKKAVPDLNKRTAYISGPDAMVTNYKGILRKLGAHGIRTDHFTGY